jgi:hypothetical protein
MITRVTYGLALAAVLLVCLPAAVGAATGPPASISFAPEPLGSWAAVGNTLDVDPGVWSGQPTSITAQWYRCDASGQHCAAISGGNSLARTLDAGDLGKTLFAQVTASNAYGSRSVSTYATGVVGAPTVTAEPVISGDVNSNGSTVSVSTGAWTGSPTGYEYRWFSCSASTLACSAIPAATSSSYQVDDSALAGDYLTAEVTASDPSGSSTNVAQPSFAVGIARTDVVEPEGTPQPIVQASWVGDASKAGNLLVGDRGVWKGEPSMFSYQWVDCPDSSLNNCAPILGATSLTYIVQASDAGHTIGFQALAGNSDVQNVGSLGGGSLVNNTYASDSGPAWAPEPSRPPQLSGDAEGAGSVLHVDGDWTAPQDTNITQAYQWVRCDASDANCAAIAGATSADYTVTGDDLGHTLYAYVEATNSYGTTAAVSTTITPTVGAPINTDAPEVSGDTGAAGNTLTVSNGSWTNSPGSYAYRWYSCDANGANCALVSGATSSTYQTTPGDTGKTLVAEVDASNGYGSTAAYSDPSGVIGSPYAVVAPTLSSTEEPLGAPIAELGDTLSVSQGTWSGSPTSFSYQWYRCDPSAPTKADFTNCNAIGGATSPSYTTTNADLGHTIYVDVAAANVTGTTDAFASPRGSVGAPQPLLDNGSIGGSAKVGTTLTLYNASSWAGDTPIAWRYSWTRCDANAANCALIAGATAQTYTLTADDEGHVIWGAVAGSNVWGGNGWGLTYDSVVVSGSSGGSGGGGSGGGGAGTSIPNLSVSWAASVGDPAPGTEEDFTITVKNTGGAGALQTHLLITLPSTITLLGPPYYERGSGCTGTQQIDCFLDYIPNGSSTVVKFSTRVGGSGTQLLSATVTADRDSDLSNNTSTERIDVGGTAPAPNPGPTTPTPTPTPTPHPSLAAPRLKQTRARTLTGVVRAHSETVDGSFTVNEPLRLTMTVTRLGSTRKATLQKGTRIAGVASRRGGSTVTRSVAHAGTLTFHLVLSKAALTTRKRYAIHIAAVNARGKKAALTIVFRA